MKRRSRDRFREIIKVFAFYGFGYIVEGKNKRKKSPENLRKAIEELGATFIKLGQILSTRTDILSEEYIKELGKLQNSAKVEDIKDLKVVFEESTNKKMEDCFLYFDETPLASASISQVHKATLMNGQSVVVKIQRPDIYEQMKMDINILKRIFKLTKSKLNISVVDPIQVLEEMENTTEKELDFNIEGENILKFKEYNKNLNSIYAPDIIREIWSNKVLVLERVEGIKINDLETIQKEGYDNKEIARKLALSYCKQIFDDGFFQSDPHPGNILIYNKKICFLDFGIVGELKPEIKKWLNSAIWAIATRDIDKVIECILAIGIKTGKVNKANLSEDVDYLFDTYLSTSLKNIKLSELLQELFNITQRNNIQLPSDLTMLVRCLLILDGVVLEIDPELEILSVVVEFVKSKNKLMISELLNKEQIAISSYQFIRDSIKLPSKTIEALNKINNGKAVVRFKIENVEELVIKLESMVNRMTGGLIVSALVIASSLIINSKAGPTYNGLSIMGIIGYLVSAFMALVLLFDMYRSTRKKNKKK